MRGKTTTHINFYNMKTKELFKLSSSIDFYENRFKDGYMEEWNNAKKERVLNIIKDINLPEHGIALDYGCGNGVFTEILALALPKWQIFGADISETAVANAKKKHPYNFFNLLEPTDEKFDFVFTHHVLEHVYDIQLATQQISDLCKKEAKMLHILPCGNENSLEHRICSMYKEGINPELGNRFFFEEEGHLRRLTSKELIELFERFNFVNKKGYFANQYYGALDWISEYDTGFINSLFDENKTVSKQSSDFIKEVKEKVLEVKSLKESALGYRKQGITYIHGLKSIPSVFKL